MWLVFQKEMIELLRDKKTLFFMIAMPVLIFPAIFAGTAYFTGKAMQEAGSKTLMFALVGQAPESLSQLLQAAEDLQQIELADNSDVKQAIISEQVDFVLNIPVDFSEAVLQSGSAEFVLYLNDAGLNFVFDRVNKIVESYANQLRAQAFAELSLDAKQQAGLLTPIKLKREDVSAKRENIGEKIGGFVPYLLLFSCLMGAIPVATDLGAGEKERGTLETLLLAPITRTQLVLGKFLSISFAGVISALVTVFSLVFWALIAGQTMTVDVISEATSQIGVIDIVLVFLMLVPVVAIFSSLMLSLSIYAKSYKEAQSYVGMLPIVLVFPIVIALMPGVKLESGWAWVPITNVSLAIKELVKGTMEYMQLFAIFASSVVIAAALLGFCIYWFRQEKVLFR